MEFWFCYIFKSGNPEHWGWVFSTDWRVEEYNERFQYAMAWRWRWGEMATSLDSNQKSKNHIFCWKSQWLQISSLSMSPVYTGLSMGHLYHWLWSKWKAKVTPFHVIFWPAFDNTNLSKNHLAVMGHQVWGSKWNERAYFSTRKAKIDHSDLCMAVLVQEIICADYAFVIHTTNPSTGDDTEIYAEVCYQKSRS